MTEPAIDQEYRVVPVGPGWLATCPQLELSTAGTTPEDALDRLLKAIEYRGIEGAGHVSEQELGTLVRRTEWMDEHFGQAQSREHRYAEPVIGVSGTVTGKGRRTSEMRKTEELAKCAFALQELRFHAAVALKHWDGMSLRKAQRIGPTGRAMLAVRRALTDPTDPTAP